MTAEGTLQQQVEHLYTNHCSWLGTLLRHKLGNGFDAAELMHDIYLVFLKNGRVPSASESRSHLTKIANGMVIDLYRRRRVEAAYMDALAAQPELSTPSEEVRALATEALVHIDTVLRGLPAKVRNALLLRKLDGVDYRDIAAAMHISTSSAEKYVAAGIQACHLALHDGKAQTKQ